MTKPTSRWTELSALALNLALTLATAAIGAVAGWLSLLLGTG